MLGPRYEQRGAHVFIASLTSGGSIAALPLWQCFDHCGLCLDLYLRYDFPPSGKESGPGPGPGPGPRGDGWELCGFGHFPCAELGHAPACGGWTFLEAFPYDLVAELTPVEYAQIMRVQYSRCKQSHCSACMFCSNALVGMDRELDRVNELIALDMRRARAARLIQRWWCNMYYDPSSRVCRDRLAREFDELNATSAFMT